MDLSISEPWLSVENNNGTFTGNTGNHPLTFDASDIEEPCTLLSHLIIKSNGGHVRFNVIMNVDYYDAIEELDNTRTLYPNPANDQLNLTQSKGLKEIRVYNLMGQLIDQYDNCSSTQLSIAHLESGHYFFELEYTDQTIRKKILKN